MLTVIYRVYLDKREKNGQFKKKIVAEITDSHNPYLVVANWRKINDDPNHRYVLGHVKY